MSLVITDSYPAKVVLTNSEAMHVLRAGPMPEWFRPWAEHAHVAPCTSRPWGYVHIHGEWGEPPAWELVGYYSSEDLAWGLEHLYKAHDWHLLDVDGNLSDHDCHGVFFWLPTDPRLLRLPLGMTR